MAKKNKLKAPAFDKGKYASITKEACEPSSESQYPVFALYNNMNLGKEFSIEGCNKEEKLKIIDILCRLSKLTWAQIRTEPKQVLGYEQISLDQINKNIPESITPPINPDDKLMIFRFGPKKSKQYRMTGYRRKNIFYILWIDTKLKLYKH
jgi:hypothetical protein